MRFLGNVLQFAGILISLIIIGHLLPLCIFQYYTWIAHAFLSVNITMWILLGIQDYIFTARINPKNKAVLITGCDTGFGNAVSKILDRRGYKVFACCLDKTGNGASELMKTGSSNMLVIQMDVTDEKSVATAVETVKDHLDKSELWAIVNNAGVLKGFHTELSKMSDYEMCLQVNTLGMIRVTKAFLPMLRKSKGRVVNVCSLAGRFRTQLMGAYMISKTAAVAFTEVLCQEMREFGVRVISIEPEFFRTPMSSEEYVTNVFTESFSEVDEEVMSAYGKDYIKNAKKIYSNIFSNSSQDIKRVYDAIETAISLQNPCDIYRPVRNIYVKSLMMLTERVPVVLHEVTVKIAFSIMGLPTPKKGLNLLSRLKNL